MLVASCSEVDGSEPTKCDMLSHGGRRAAELVSDFRNSKNVLHFAPLGQNPGGATGGVSSNNMQSIQTKVNTGPKVSKQQAKSRCHQNRHL